MKKIIFLLSIIVIIPNITGTTEAFDFMTDIVKSFQSSEIAGSLIKTSETKELV